MNKKLKDILLVSGLLGGGITLTFTGFVLTICAAMGEIPFFVSVPILAIGITSVFVSIALSNEKDVW